MTSILCVADSHWNRSSRAAEAVRIHDWILAQAAELRPDGILLGGDLFDGPASPVDREVASAWVQAIAAISPVCAIRGNHDRQLEVFHLRRLSSRHPIVAVEDPGVHLVGGVAVACLPWPNGGSLLASLNAPSKSDARAVGIDALQAILRGLDAELDEYPGVPKVLLGHCSIAGAKTGTGATLLGMDFELGLADLALVRCDAFVLGHVHARAMYDIAGRPACYVGSPFSGDYGDPGPKGIALLELEPRQPAQLRWLDSPAQQLITIDAGRFDPDRRDWNGPGPWPETLVERSSFRVRYQVQAEHAASAAAVAAQLRESLMSYGATAVKVEPEVLVSNHARIPEVGRGMTVSDQLRAYWQATPDQYPGDLQERLLARLAELGTP